jgi:hypothetical protein
MWIPPDRQGEERKKALYSLADNAPAPIREPVTAQNLDATAAGAFLAFLGSDKIGPIVGYDRWASILDVICADR